MRLLLTRPVADAARSAAALRARGHDVVLAPLIRIEPVPADVGAGANGPWAAVLITSANALAGVRVGELTSVPLIAVGDHSAAAARAAGFADVSSASGAVGDLAARYGKRNSCRINGFCIFRGPIKQVILLPSLRPRA